MADDLVNKAYDTYSQESRQFDYYVTGGCGIALGYALQGFHQTFWRLDLIAFASWGMLLVALACGLGALRARVATLSMGVALHTLERDIIEMTEALQSGRIVRQTLSGQTFSGPALLAQHRARTEAREEMDADINRTQRRALRLVRGRDWALSIGVLGFAAWRILSMVPKGS